MSEIEQLKEMYQTNQSLLEQGRAEQTQLQQQESDDKFEKDWHFTSDILKREDQLRTKLAEIESKQLQVQENLDPHLIEEARKYKEELAEMDTKRPLYEKFNSVGYVPNGDLVNFNSRYDELIARRDSDQFLRRGLMLLEIAAEKQPEPEESIAKEVQDLPFPTASELAKQVHLSTQDFELYGLIRHAIQRGRHTGTNQLMEVLYKDRPDVRHKQNALSEAIKQLRARAANANIAIPNIAPKRQYAIYDLAFINPPAETEGSKSVLETSFDSKAFFDSVEPTLQQPLIDFLQSGDFEQLINSATKFFALTQTSESYRKFLLSAFGFTVESIAFPFMQSKIRELYNDQASIVSPDQTFWIYSCLYPGTEISSHYDLQRSIRGISFPDFIVISKDVESTQILGVGETTASSLKSNSKRAQISRYVNNKGSVLFDLMKIFNQNDRYHSRGALLYFQREFPDFPTNYNLPDNYLELKVFFTILQDTPNIPGANSEDIFRMPFSALRLFNSLEVILTTTRKQIAAGSNIDPKIFLP